MKLPTRILAATDLSAPARHATERAALVSKDSGAPLAKGARFATCRRSERLRQFTENTPGQLERRVLDAARQRLHDLAPSHYQTVAKQEVTCSSAF